VTTTHAGFPLAQPQFVSAFLHLPVLMDCCTGLFEAIRRDPCIVFWFRPVWPSLVWVVIRLFFWAKA